MSGRYGHDPFDREDSLPPRPPSKPRIRIIPQRKATKKKRTPGVMYEPNEQAMSVKEFIKRAVLDDERLSPHDIAALIEEAGYRNPATIVMISNVRAEFRDSLKLLKTLGWRQAK
jgi:hypothetical protein